MVQLTPSDFAKLVERLVLVAALSGVVGGLVWSVVAGLFSSWLHSAAESSRRLALVKAARARAASGVWGMGQGPMSGSSRPAYPHQGAGGELGRVIAASLCPTQAHGDGGRVVGRSNDPRSIAADQAGPLSCLKDKRAAGVPVSRCAHGGSGDSGEVHSTSEELTLPPSRPRLPVLGS